MHYFVIKSKGIRKLNEDLKWTTNISNEAKKEKSTGFLIRKFRYCPLECKKTVNINDQVNNGKWSIAWDPYRSSNTK